MSNPGSNRSLAFEPDNANGILVGHFPRHHGQRVSPADLETYVHPDPRQLSIPRYIQLADLMRQRIARCIWTWDRKLPSLDELTAEFAVARVTVRQAIDPVAQEGLVYPQRGRGTFVSSVPKTGRIISVVTSLAELARSDEDTDPTIVNIEESMASTSLRPGEGPPVPSYAFMRRVHSRHRHPYCVINFYLDERIFKDPEGMVIYLADVTYRGDAIRLEMNLQP